MEQFEELSLKRLAEIIFKHIAMIIAVTLITGILAFVYSETMIVPEYESSVSIIVNNKDSDGTVQTLSTGDIAASQMLVDTYIVIVKSDKVLEQVSARLYEEYDIAYSTSNLRNMITASSVDDTEIFEITVRDTDEYKTFVIANVIAEVAPDVIREYVEASSVKVIDLAKEGKKVSPNIQTNMIIGLILGLFISCAFVVLKEIFDLRIKTEEDLNQWFKMPILGTIPDITNSQQLRKPGYYSYRRYSRSYEYSGKDGKANGGKSIKSKTNN